MIYNAIIHEPGVNVNGRYYSPKVCEQIAKQLNGVLVFPDVKLGGKRDPKEAIGTVRYAECDKNNRVVAVLDLNSTPLVMGLAINAVGRTHLEQQHGKQVTAIDEIGQIFSVDLTDEPASGDQILP